MRITIEIVKKSIGASNSRIKRKQDTKRRSEVYAVRCKISSISANDIKYNQRLRNMSSSLAEKEKDGSMQLEI